MKKPSPRQLKVVSTQQISANLKRVTLSGEDLHDFPSDQTGGYVKLFFDDQRYVAPLARTYTVRYTRLEQLEIDVDFALHEHGGPAAQWAMQATPGTQILVGGPGPKKMVDPNADWYLLAGDMTALPAISVNLEDLKQQCPDAVGHAILEVVSKDDIHQIDAPKGIEFHWILNSRPGENPSILVDAIRNIEWQAGNVGVWTACEFNTMKQLRKFYLKEKMLERKAIYLSSYWKHGVSEDEHKVIKREDAAN